MSMNDFTPFDPLDPSSWNSANNPNPQHPENGPASSSAPPETSLRGLRITLRSGAELFVNIIGSLGLNRGKRGNIKGIHIVQPADSAVKLGWLDASEIVALTIMPTFTFCEHGDPLDTDDTEV